MLLGEVFDNFVQKSPVSVMVRGLLEKVLCPHRLDKLFECSPKTQYTRELLFSTLVNLISLVVCGIHPSVHAAHQAYLARQIRFKAFRPHPLSPKKVQPRTFVKSKPHVSTAKILAHKKLENNTP
ncbi:MAG: hypothetical protein V7K47_25665 [Nostoc sp.]